MLSSPPPRHTFPPNPHRDRRQPQPLPPPRRLQLHTSCHHRPALPGRPPLFSLPDGGVGTLPPRATASARGALPAGTAVPTRLPPPFKAPARVSRPRSAWSGLAWRGCCRAGRPLGHRLARPPLLGASRVSARGGLRSVLRWPVVTRFQKVTRIRSSSKPFVQAQPSPQARRSPHVSRGALVGSLMESPKASSLEDPSAQTNSPINPAWLLQTP